MKALYLSNKQLSVDDIIERILIRNNGTPFEYNRKDRQQQTPSEHIWHYELQEENLDLKGKIKELTAKCRKKQQFMNRQKQLNKQIDKIKAQLQTVISDNAQLQNQINRLRLKNSQINDSIRHSADQSINKKKRNKECSCQQSQHHRQNEEGKKVKKVKQRVVQEQLSKSVLKMTREVSINCNFNQNINYQSEVMKKRQHILALRKIIKNQQRVIKSYENQLQQSSSKQQMYRKKTMASVNRLPFERPTSQTTFKPLSSVGSIVKIKRF